MKKILWLLVMFLVISGCEDMKMDRKVEKSSALVM